MEHYLFNYIFRNVEFSKSVETQTKAVQQGEGQHSPEAGVKERTHKKRKEKPREGTSKNMIKYFIAY